LGALEVVAVELELTALPAVTPRPLSLSLSLSRPCQPSRRRSPVAAADGPVESSIDILEMLSCDDATVMERVDRWYVHDRDAVWVRRNLLINLGNVADPADQRTVAALRDALADDRPVLRAHAVWAAARLGLRGLLPADDPDGMVRDELSRLPALRGDL
ncbi:MAG: hypothetical protein ACK49M_01020, partial [Actinomycetes bacterium]